MTTATPEGDRPDIDALARGLDGTLQQRAAAIAAFVDGRIDVRTPEIISEIFGTDREVLAGLAQRVEELHQRYGSQPAVRGAAATLAEATRAHNETDVTSEGQVEADVARTQRAAEAVDQAERELAATDSSGSQPASPAESDSPLVSRVEHYEHDLTRMGGRVDQLEACLAETQVVSATAFAHAQAGNDQAARRQALWIALGVLGATFVIYAIIVAVSGVEWSWNWAIGLPAVAGGIAGLIAYGFLREEGPSATSVAAADAIVVRWSQQNVDDRDTTQDDDVDDHIVPGMQQPAQRGATAVAGASAHV